jgi:segregation and condensation protein A
MQPVSPVISTTSAHNSAPHFVTPAFEGPLDLLLHLIRANQVDIYDIPIAEITQQYLAYMEILEELDLTIAGEYVLIAATLIEIKSRMLLPLPPPAPGEDEPEDPRAELVARLVEYQQYQGTIETLRTWEELRRQIFFRGAAATPDDYILPVPEGEASVSQLLAALQRVLNASGLDEKPVTSVVPRRRLSLKLKMAEVARRTAAAGENGLSFEALFELPCPRYDLVITFLALLELLRSGRVRAEQAGPLEPITLFHSLTEPTPVQTESADQQ